VPTLITVRIVKVFALISLFSAFLLSAEAHTSISSTNPEYKSTITEMPDKISIEFANPLMTVGDNVINTINVVDPQSKKIDEIKSTTQGNLLSALIPKGMYESGTYTVYYRAVSSDGHAVSGSYEFYVKFKSTTPLNEKEADLDFLHRHRDHIYLSTGTLIALLIFSIRKFLRKRDHNEES
jgi:methionine-rich copper-binding protein CopC